MQKEKIQPDDLTPGVGPDETKTDRKEGYHSDRFEGDVSWNTSNFPENVEHRPDGNTPIDNVGLYENWFWGGIDRE